VQKVIYVYILNVFFVPYSDTAAQTRYEETGKNGELTDSTALVFRRKEVYSGLKPMDENIYLIFCIVKVKPCTSTCIDTKGPMQNLCTMMP
jgi:hypothetical protein